jgi:hypothetical protein
MERLTNEKEDLTFDVATLALGSRPRQGLQGYGPRGKPGNHDACSQECKGV